MAIGKLEKFLKKGFEPLQASELVSIVCRVHGILHTGIAEVSSFREALVTIKRGGAVFHEVENMKKVLASTPKELKIYEDLILELEGGIDSDSLVFAELKMWLKQYASDPNMSMYLKQMVVELSKKDRVFLRDSWDAFMQIVANMPNHPGKLLFERFHKIIGAQGGPKNIEKKLKRAFKKTKEFSNPLDAAAYLHMRLVEIHPFDDGNGGVARLMAFALLTKKGIRAPMLFSNKDYMAVVDEAAEKSNYKIFARYLEEQIKNTEEIVNNPQKMAEYTALIKDLQECNEDCQERCEKHLKALGIVTVKL